MDRTFETHDISKAHTHPLATLFHNSNAQIPQPGQLEHRVIVAEDHDAALRLQINPQQGQLLQIRELRQQLAGNWIQPQFHEAPGQGCRRRDDVGQGQGRKAGWQSLLI